MKIILFLKCETVVGKDGYIEHFLFNQEEHPWKLLNEVGLSKSSALWILQSIEFNLHFII